MSDSLELPGNEQCPMYHLHYFGGPLDGSVINSFRPYFQTVDPDGSVYKVKDMDDYLIWVNDFTSKIELFYKGKKNDLGRM